MSSKKILCKNDIESLNAIADEFKLLDRFSTDLESPEKRKLVIGSLGLFTSGAAVGIGITNISNRPQEVRWKYVSFTHQQGESNTKKSQNPILAEAMPRLADLLNQMTEGKFTIEPHTAKNLESSDSHLDLINNKTVDCGIAGIYFSQTKRGLYFGTGIPFGLNPEEQTAWLAHKRESKDKTFMEEVYEKYGYGNILPIPLIATGHQMGGFFPKEINGSKDLSGITMRIPGLGGNVLRAMNEKFCFYGGCGGLEENKPIHAIDIPELMNNKKIHAFEFTGPHDDYRILQSITIPIRDKLIYHYPGWWEPGTTFELQINRQSWDALGESYQSILRAACAQIYKQTLAEYNIENSKKLVMISEESRGIKFKRFDDLFLKEAEEATEKLLDDYAKKIGAEKDRENFKFAYDEWKIFKKRVRAWSNFNFQNK
ncbi:MAG: hypothetical protein U1E82_07885 [Nitrosomonas sp.]